MFDVTKVQDISILHLYGEISQLETQYIQEIFHSLKNCDHRKIVLDLASVDHVHFKAVEQWAQEAQLLSELEGGVCIVKPNCETKHMMRFTGADQHLKDYETLADAILSFLKSPSVFSDGSVMSLQDAEGLTTVVDEKEKTKRTSSLAIH